MKFPDTLQGHHYVEGTCKTAMQYSHVTKYSSYATQHCLTQEVNTRLHCPWLLQSYMTIIHPDQKTYLEEHIWGHARNQINASTFLMHPFNTSALLTPLEPNTCITVLPREVRFVFPFQAKETRKIPLLNYRPVLRETVNFRLMKGMGTSSMDFPSKNGRRHLKFKLNFQLLYKKLKWAG